MSIIKFVNLDFIRVRVFMHQYPDGASLLNLNCVNPDCDRKCAMTYKTPPEDWRVTPEQHAEKFSMLCVKLEKLAEEIAKPVGQKSLI